MDNNTKWTETLARSYDVLFAELEPHLSPEECEQIVLRQLLALGDRVIGGTQVYFPKPDSIRRAVRDRQIWHQFTGTNYDALAIQYKLTTQQIRNIINEQKRYQLAKVQPMLF